MCNYAQTAFYINYNHHNVADLRKMYAQCLSSVLYILDKCLQTSEHNILLCFMQDTRNWFHRGKLPDQKEKKARILIRQRNKQSQCRIHWGMFRLFYYWLRLFRYWLFVTTEFIKEHVAFQVTIQTVHEVPQWFYLVCTSCYKQVDLVQDEFHCQKCQRFVPEPEKKYTSNYFIISNNLMN